MIKKTALASAISLALLNPVWAACPSPEGYNTSTCEGQFILDKTTVNAGGSINLAILGLESTGAVDRFGEQSGSTLIAVVNTIKGQIRCTGTTAGSSNVAVNGGCSTRPGVSPGGDDPTEGSFASQVRYVSLVAGNGKVNIAYPPTASGEDTVSVILQEKAPTTGGGVEFREIARATKTITINPAATNPEALYIARFIANSTDSRGMSDADTTKGDATLSNSESIHGKMTAGVDGRGAQIEVWAKKATAAGPITVALRKKGAEEPTYTFEGDMIEGKAIITLNSSVIDSESSETDPDSYYYIEATMEGFDGNSVDLLNKDIVEVFSTGIPQKLKVSVDKSKVLKPDFDNRVAPGSLQDMQLMQGTKVSLSFLDAYGNITTNDPARSNLEGPSFNIAISDSNNIINQNALSLELRNDGTVVSTTSDDILGNVKDELRALGIASMVATPVDVASNPLPTIAASDPYQFEVVNRGLFITVLPTFAPGATKLAGTEFSAFKAQVIDDKGNILPGTAANSTLNPGIVSITAPKPNKETITVLRRDENNQDELEALFKKVTASPAGGPYKFASTSAAYADVMQDAGGISIAAANTVDFQNAHSLSVRKLPALINTAQDKAISTVPESSFKMMDSFGNMLTASTGGYTLTSAVGTTQYPAGNNGSFGVPSGPSLTTLSYDVIGENAFAGDDPVTANFTKPGLTTNSLQLTVEVPELPRLTDIKAYIEQATIPVNSEVPFTVELFDQNGEAFEGVGSEKATIVMDFGTGEGDTIQEPVISMLGGGMIASGQRVDFVATHRKVFTVNAGSVTGQFTVVLMDADEQVSTSHVFTVTQELQTTCTPSNPEGCEDEVTCNAVGGGYSGTECSAVPALGTLAIDSAGAFVDPLPAGANIKGGYSVNGNPFANPASATDVGARIKIVGSIEAADADVGAEADIIAMYAGVELGGDLATAPIFILVNEATEIAQWDGTIENIPAFSTTTLEEYNVVNIFDTGEGGFNIEGELYVLVAYRTANGNIVFGENLLQLEIDDPRN